MQKCTYEFSRALPINYVTNNRSFANAITQNIRAKIQSTVQRLSLRFNTVSYIRLIKFHDYERDDSKKDRFIV